MARSYGPVAARSGRDGFPTAQSGLEHALLEKPGGAPHPRRQSLALQ